jgi:hypothetical protein
MATDDQLVTHRELRDDERLQQFMLSETALRRYGVADDMAR